MVEQFENNYTTLLNGAIDSDDTTIVVDAGPDTMTGEFRVKIDDELIMVGSVSGTTFSDCIRGIEGTTAASHSDNAVVEHILTAGSLEQGIINLISTRSGPIDYDIQSYTGGDISLTSTTPVAVSGPSDLIVRASTGDMIFLGIVAMPTAATAQSMRFDYATMVSGSPVNYLSSGNGTPLAVPPHWYIGSAEVVTAQGHHPYIVQSSDISSGTVTFRLYYSVSGTRTVNADSTQPLILSAINIGGGTRPGKASGARAVKSGTQSLNTSTWTPITFTAADKFDTDGYHDPSSDNTRFTIPAGCSGSFIIGYDVLFDSSSATGSRYSTLYLNGSNESYNFRTPANSSGADWGQSRVLAMELMSDDYVELYCFQDSGGNLNVDGASFWIMRVDSGNGSNTLDTTRVIYGRVAGDGTILTGTGFSVVRNGNGDYTITWDVAFSSSPTVNATLGEFTSGRPSIATRAVGGGTPNTTEVQILTGVVGVSLADQIFSFVAMGT